MFYFIKLLPLLMISDATVRFFSFVTPEPLSHYATTGGTIITKILINPQ